MSKYTMELRGLCDLFTRETIESWFKDYDLTDYLTEEENNVVVSRGTWSKDKLATKIVDYYLMREIGSETPELFKHYVKGTMRGLMEKYAPLIYSASIKYDPLVNVDFTEKFNRDATSEGNSTVNNNGSGIAVNSDTPQGQINKDKILEGNYASNVGATSQENQTTDNTNTKNQEAYTKTVKGNSGVSATAQRMIGQYRENIITIDNDIIKDLEVLFMGIF